MRSVELPGRTAMLRKYIRALSQTWVLAQRWVIPTRLCIPRRQLLAWRRLRSDFICHRLRCVDGRPLAKCRRPSRVRLGSSCAKNFATI